MSKSLAVMVSELSSHPVSKSLALADSWDGGDVWGSALEEAFSLCDFLTFRLGRRDLVPDGLGYRPALGGYADDEGSLFLIVSELWPSSGLTPEDVGEYLGRLDRVLDECLRLGVDY